MNGGTEIVLKAGQRQLSRASAAAKSGLGFKDDDGVALLRNSDRRGEAVGAGADDDGVVGAVGEMHEVEGWLKAQGPKFNVQSQGTGDREQETAVTHVQSTRGRESGRMGIAWALPGEPAVAP